MAIKYEITCGCGLKMQVEARQAGESIACACGRLIDVPTLRGLAELPQVVQQETGSRGWTRTQGVCFVAGMVWLAVGAVVTWQIWARATRPVEIQRFDRIAEDFSARVDRLTPSESLTYWQMFRDQPVGTLASHQRVLKAGSGNSQWVWLTWLSGAATLIGLAIIGYGLVAGRQSRSKSHPAT